MTPAGDDLSDRPNTRPQPKFRDRLRNGPPLLLDGATGTELTRRGVDTGLPMWSAKALISAPDTLVAIHRDYVEAGAEIVTANTFRTHRRSLAAAGLGDEAATLTSLAVQLARRAIKMPPAGGGRNVYVAGSIAPLEDCYSPDLVPDSGVLATEHGEMATALADAGADLLLVETMNTIREAVAAAQAAVATGIPALVGFVCGRDGKLLSGEGVAEAARTMESLGVDGILINCSPTPGLDAVLGELGAATDLPIGAYGNVGYADDAAGWVNTDSVDPAAYARHAEVWLSLGARIIGSCCGTGPAHTAALRASIAAWRG
jgi:S-methylmethionine-dependent homocysteine/selenocysteine methylase